MVRDAAPRVGSALAQLLDELVGGWRFLRGKAALIQNTLISTLAQMTVGVTLALTVVYARDALDGRSFPIRRTTPRSRPRSASATSLAGWPWA